MGPSSRSARMAAVSLPVPPWGAGRREARSASLGRRALADGRKAGTGLFSIRESFTDEPGLLFAGAVLSGTRRRRRKGARDLCSHFVAILVAPFVVAHGLDRLCVGLGQRLHDLLGRRERRSRALARFPSANAAC